VNSDASIAAHNAPTRMHACDDCTVAQELALPGPGVLLEPGVLLSAPAESLRASQKSMEHLETPAFLVFLHMCALLAVLAALASQGLASISASPTELRAAVPSAVFEALQLILLFATFNHGAVVVVVAATAAAATFMAGALPAFALQSSSVVTSTQQARSLRRCPCRRVHDAEEPCRAPACMAHLHRHQATRCRKLRPFVRKGVVLDAVKEEWDGQR
jgi:hypothetical protein